ncbi:MAG: bifunctional folylpolyglutamate synthase/dihydrofolate synthase [Candidatus Zixiibacteriota bacterium]|nr:MAG: bifunctional folylpolyglutamate synthase/dihydrofolate synthase [candidate division Zixibacteria bacterium]
MAKDAGEYRAAMDFIMAREHFGIKLGLRNITSFLKAAGCPHNDYPSVLIAGTNGKGSTAAAIDAVIREAGYKVGIFTSPHLVDFRERIRVNGRLISRQYITSFIKKHRRVIEKHRITFFEVCTALAFCYFADKKVDLAIVEVGLGGRLDATNTLSPILSIITDISYDHTNILGSTIRKIAREKAGIIKAKSTVLTGLLPPEARGEVTRTCRIKKAPLIQLSKKDFARNGKPFRFDYFGSASPVKNLRFSLPGNHQIHNAAIVLQAAGILREKGFSITRKAIRAGLKNTSWPGRFQICKRRGKPAVILDVGHNPAGVRAMVACFRELYPGRKADLVMGFVRHKSLREIVRCLQLIARRVEIARLQTDRSTDPAEVIACFSRGIEVNASHSLVVSARKLVRSAADDDIVIVCGSHFAVGEFLARQHTIL